MISPRVNLIRKAERRYQGAVSRRFLLVSIVVFPILAIAILSGVKLIQYNTVRMDLKAKNDIWEDLEPRLKLFKQEAAGLKTNQQMLEMLARWETSKRSPVALLTDIQDRIPDNIQLTRLSFQRDSSVAVYRSIAALQQPFSLVLQGFSHGEQAENAVFELQKDLLAADSIRKTFNSVKLASMRKQMTKDGENIRTFSLEGGE